MPTVKFQLRRDTAANWTSVNPTLGPGEPAVETDTGKRKYGNGVNTWNTLPYAVVGAGDVLGAGALTRTNDTNVTLTLGGSPTGALLAATSVTVGWSGQLAVSRGGTGVSTLTGYVKGNGASAFTASASIPAADISGGGALTRSNDTNVTLTLGGAPTVALLAATSLTLGWSGTLAVSRGGTGGGTASGTLIDNISGFSSTGHLVRTAAGTYAFRTMTGTSNRIDVSNGSGVSGNPTVDISASYVGQTSITTLGTITTGTWNGTSIAAANGGTGQSSYAIGDLLYASTTSALSKLADVATGNALISGGIGVAPSWGKVGLTTHVSGTLPVASGGTGAATLSSNTLLKGNGTGAVAASIIQDNGTEVGVGTAPVATFRHLIKGTGTGSGTYAQVIRNSANTNLHFITDDGAFYTGDGAASPYNNTTAAAANAVLGIISGQLLRSTSSRRYKTGIRDYTNGLSAVNRLRPVFYQGNNDGKKEFAGLIAEEVHEAGLHEFVQYDEQGRPDALYYANMVALLTKAVQELSAEVATLKAAKV